MTLTPAALPPPMPSAPPTTSSTAIVLIVLMWLAWIGVLLVADFFGFMMLAFADSPGSGKSAQLMIVPLFAWFGVTFVAGVLLLVFKGWWQVPLAFVLAISPPFLVFLGYNVFAAAPRVSVPTGPSPPPPVRMNVPAGGFRPTSSPTTQPTFKMPEIPRRED